MMIINLWRISLWVTRLTVWSLRQSYIYGIRKVFIYIRPDKACNQKERYVVTLMKNMALLCAKHRQIKY